MASIRIAFWNLQNLFDLTASPIAADFGFTPGQGWSPAVFERKVLNLAHVIRGMHGGQAPDLLGVCEVENRDVMETLQEALGREDYALAHVESPDIRGIDTSLIYSRDVFELAGDPVGHLVHLRYPTRDIFQVPLRVKTNGAELTVFVNHWPSRRQGLYESEPFRLTVASHCGSLVDSVLKLNRREFLDLPDTEASLNRLNDRWNDNVLLLGDFNDEPFNRSILNYLLAASGLDRLEEPIRKSPGSQLPKRDGYLGRPAYLFNCMWPLMGNPDEGTLFFAESTNTMNLLDQFIISRGLLLGLKGLRFDVAGVEIFKPDVMSTALKRRPKPFEFDRDGVVTDGYSDHFPIQAVIEVL